MYRPILAALVMLASLPALASEPPITLDHCEAKAAVLAPVSVLGAGFVADLHGDMESNLAINLLHYEAIDVTGMDIVLIRTAGSGYGRIIAFRSGCREKEIWLPNLYIEVMQRVRKEQGA